MTGSVEDLERAFGAVGDLLGGLTKEQWGAATPCSAWDVRDVVNHLVAVNSTFAASIEGGTLHEQGADLVGDDPLGAYRRSAAALLEVLGRAQVRERLEEGPLAEQVQLRLADLVTHGWDLTQATGVPVELPAEFAERSLDFIQRQLAVRPRGTQFAEAQPVDDDAPAVDRLAAFAGRTITRG